MNIQTTISKKTANIRGDLKILMQTPFAFVSMYSRSAKKTVVIKDYDPKANNEAKKLVKLLKRECPHLVVHFTGSTAFELPGDNDIDVIVEYASTAKQVRQDVSRLSLLFGTYTNASRNYHEWVFARNGYKVDLIYASPTSKIYRELMAVYIALKKSKRLLAQYRKLKIGAQGKSMREYHRKKIEFYNSIVFGK